MTVPVLAGLRADGTADPAVADRVARAWLSGGLVGLPTETVYGLAADAEDPAAVSRIYATKGRPADHPLIVHVAGVGAIDGWSAAPDRRVRALAEALWPGPLTLVVRRSARAGDHLTGGQETVALRCPGHPVAHACLVALAALSGTPARGVAAPSANRFGRVSPTRAADVVEELGRRLDPARDLIVDGGPSAVGVESTIVDCTAERPLVLRLGAISQAQVDEVLQRAGLLEAGGAVVSGAAGDEGGAGSSAGARSTVRAPGTLESHYAPSARVILVEPGSDRVPTAPSTHDPFRLSTQEGAQPESIKDEAVARDGADEPTEAAAGDGADQLGTREASSRSVIDGPRPDAPTGLIAGAEVPTPDGWVRLAEPATAAEYAQVLYAALRRADALGLATVVAFMPDPDAGPLARAVRDRLARAAHGR